MLFHSDIRGPTLEFDTHGLKYYVLFIDDRTKMSWIYFIKHKPHVSETFISSYEIIET